MASDNVGALSVSSIRERGAFRDLLTEGNVAAPGFRKNECYVSSSEGAKCFCDEGEEESDPRHLQGSRGKKERKKTWRTQELRDCLPAGSLTGKPEVWSSTGGS